MVYRAIEDGLPIYNKKESRTIFIIARDSFFINRVEVFAF